MGEMKRKEMEQAIFTITADILVLFYFEQVPNFESTYLIKLFFVTVYLKKEENV